VSEVHAASIIRVVITLMMEAARTSETMVNFYQTMWHYIPEDSHLQNQQCFEYKGTKVECTLKATF
jgi:hypothetical protein